MTEDNSKKKNIPPFQDENLQLLNSCSSREGIDVLEFVHPLEEVIDVLEFTAPSAQGIDVLEFIHPPEAGIEVLEFASQQEEKNGMLCGKTLEMSENYAQAEEQNFIAKHAGSIEEKQKVNLTPIDLKKQEIIKAEDSTATNFTVQPVCQYVYINRKGEEIEEKAVIECAVCVRQTFYQEIIGKKDIAKLTKIILRKYPAAILDYEDRRGEKNIEIKFREAMHKCPKKKVYFEAGWQGIGEHPYYLRDELKLGENIKIETGMTLPTYFPYNAELLLTIYRKAVDIYKDPTVMATIFTFSLMGVLYRLFKDAGFPPRFTLFVYGKTGSLKTSIAKVFFTQLCNAECRDNVRRIDADTAVSLERAVVLTGHDTVTLIDDFSPAKTKVKKREMDDKLEMLIRMVGDGSSRSRSNVKLEDRRGEGVQGMVALTGELRGKGVSSNLRCLYCRLEREKADEKTLSWFQDNPKAFTTLIATFADFIGENYIGITESIREKMGEERKRLSDCLRERRMIDSAATLCIAADIFKRFLEICCRMPDKEAEIEIMRMRKAVINCTKISEEMSTEESPSVTFIQAISVLMRANQIVLNTDKVKMAEVSEYDGFMDENFLYFNPDIIHKKVVAFLQRTNRYYPFEPKEVWTMLAEEGILKTGSNGAGKRTLCVRIPVGNGVRHNFLKIRKTIFEAVCEGDYDCQKGEKY